MIKLISLYKAFINKISLIFPQNNCIYCGENSQNFLICNKCSEIFAHIVPITMRCKKCGRELISEKNYCIECRENMILQNIDFCFPLHSYLLSEKEILHKWKNESIRIFSFFFATILAKTILSNFPNTPIVPIPPRPNKIKKKGWDQIDDLVFYLKQYKEIKILRILKRETNIQQKKLNRNQRLSHKANVYKINYNYINKKFIIPQKVILLDDIITTGATLESCGELLKKLGIKEVFAITLYSVD